MHRLIWAMTWENLFLPYRNNEGADQPAHPRSLISAFVIRCLDSIIPLVYRYPKFQASSLVSVGKQTGLSLGWSEKPKTGFLMTWLVYLCRALISFHKFCCVWALIFPICQLLSLREGPIKELTKQETNSFLALHIGGKMFINPLIMHDFAFSFLWPLG